jgi:hypothetical protein
MPADNVLNFPKAARAGQAERFLIPTKLRDARKVARGKPFRLTSGAIRLLSQTPSEESRRLLDSPLAFLPVPTARHSVNQAHASIVSSVLTPSAGTRHVRFLATGLSRLRNTWTT